MIGRGRYQLLQDAIDHARALLANGTADESTLARAATQLRDAWANASDSDVGAQVRELLAELDGVRITAAPREVDLPACVVCSGGEFLRSREPVTIRASLHGPWFFEITAEMLICRACGDIRWIADPAKALVTNKTVFERVVIKQAPRSPLR